MSTSLLWQKPARWARRIVSAMFAGLFIDCKGRQIVQARYGCNVSLGIVVQLAAALVGWQSGRRVRGRAHRRASGRRAGRGVRAFRMRPEAKEDRSDLRRRCCCEKLVGRREVPSQCFEIPTSRLRDVQECPDILHIFAASMAEACQNEIRLMMFPALERPRMVPDQCQGRGRTPGRGALCQRHREPPPRRIR